MAIPSVVLGCLPTCCAKMVDKRKIIGAVGMFLGAFSWFMPLIGALAGADGACESMCDQSECENDTWCRDSA